MESEHWRVYWKVIESSLLLSPDVFVDRTSGKFIADVIKVLGLDSESGEVPVKPAAVNGMMHVVDAMLPWLLRRQSTLAHVTDAQCGGLMAFLIRLYRLFSPSENVHSTLNL